MLRRRRILFNVGIVLAFVGGIFAVLVAMVYRTPSFYTQAEMPAGYYRETASNKALSQLLALREGFNSEEEWQSEFSEEELNAFFQENYVDAGGDDNLPPGFSQPRVKIEEGRMRLGVRYKNSVVQTVLSIEIKMWLVAGEANLLALEVVSLQAGSLPLSPATLLDYISESARAQNIEVTWYRNNDHPVALLRFQAEVTRPTFQFEQVKLTNGKLIIKGRSTENLPPPK